ncbi:MAG: hypothetical protein R3C58_12255 [Parvularculaceae bacterium]
MSLDPLLEAPLVIQIHAFGAMAAFVLGVVQIAAPKGTLPHKTLGAVWLVIMFVVGVASIFVRPSLQPGLPISQWFSPIHLFTVLTFYGIAQGLYLLARGGPQLKFHSRPFVGLFIGGLVVAGVLAFLPGRIMHKVAFGF